MNRQEHIIFRYINSCPGKELAIPVPILTRRVNYTLREEGFLSESRVRQIVRDLIVKHGELIGSIAGAGSLNHSPGYYMITDEAEVKEVVKSLKERALKILQRGAKIEKVGLREFIGQLKLELEYGTES